MGLSPFKPSKGGDTNPPAGNPVPHRFEVLRKIYRPDDLSGLVAIVRYPDCTNFEGTKVLVFRSQSDFERLRATGSLDPHFMESEPGLVARFRPDEDGVNMAIKLAATLGRRT